MEVDVQQGNFKILQLLSQVLILFLVEKWIPPRSLKIAKIGKKTEGILGVKKEIDKHYKLQDVQQCIFVATVQYMSLQFSFLHNFFSSPEVGHFQSF